MSFRVGPLCIGLISAWFKHAGSRHNVTFPLALGTSTKLLHLSDVSLTPQGAIMSCFCSLYNSSLKDFEVYMPCILEVLGMAYYLALAIMKM